MSLFGIEASRQVDGNGNSHSSRFHPLARLVLLPNLRTSGLLALLTDAEAHTLLAVLTFLTPDGRLQATLPELAQVLGISERAVKAIMMQLTSQQFEGQPILYEILREDALSYYTPSPALIRYLGEVTPQEDFLATLPSESRSRVASREEIVAMSRDKYARPREEVERIVLEQLGYSLEETDDTPEGEVRRRLLGVGISREEIEALLSNHPLLEIRSQLDWLPHRNAKNPARFLIAAIQNRYDPPTLLRQEAMTVGNESSSEPFSDAEPGEFLTES